MKFYQIVGFFKKTVDDKWQSIPPCGIAKPEPYDELHKSLQQRLDAKYVIFTTKEVNLNEPLGDK